MCCKPLAKPPVKNFEDWECERSNETVQLSFQNRWQVVARCSFALLLFPYCGFAHLATVKTIPARLSTGLRVEEPLDSSAKYLFAAEHERPLAALSHDLLAAKISYGVLERHPKNESARSIYNF